MINIIYEIKVYLRFMEKREPYNLKGLIAAYNLMQVILCSFMVYTAYELHPHILNIWKCHNIDWSDNERAVGTVQFMYWTIFTKILDFMDTVFFVLRKKYNQVSVLHVFHHVTVVAGGWFMTKYHGG